MEQAAVQPGRLAAGLALFAALAGCGFAGYEVPTLPEEPVLKSLSRIGRFIERRDLEGVLSVYADDFQVSAYDAGLWVEQQPSQDLEIRRWTPGSVVRFDRQALRSGWKDYLEGYQVVGRVELKPRDLAVEGDHAEARFYLDIRGTDRDGRFRADHLWFRWRLRRSDSQDWAIAGQQIVEGESLRSSRRRFREVARQAGVAYPHIPGERRDAAPSAAEGSPLVARGDSGVAMADFDDDGYPDLYFCDGMRNALMRNLGNGTFEDVTAKAGLEKPQKHSRSAVFFDADNDGDLDLYVTYDASPCRFHENLGNGTFRERPGSGLELTGMPSSVAVADFDGDGLLDVFVSMYGDYYETYPEVKSKNGAPDHLFRNRGGLTFEDVTGRAGVGDRGWGLACSWGDYDNDGDPDLFVCNDFGTNALYRNDGKGRFTDVTSRSGVDVATFGMSSCFGDYDNDGDLDLFLAGMYSNAGQWIFKRKELLPVPWMLSFIRNRVLGTLDGMTDGNRLLRNDGDGRFTEVAAAAGVEYGQWAWGSPWVDIDNDGWLDVYCCNGYWTGPDEEDL